MDYLLISEAALDIMLMHRLFDSSGLPLASRDRGLRENTALGTLRVIASTSEPTETYFALVRLSALTELLSHTKSQTSDAFGRIARVVKALRSPPIHLPRPWSEFHHKNLLTFFALPKSKAGYRWIVDTSSVLRCARFELLTNPSKQIELLGYQPPEWPRGVDKATEWCGELRKAITEAPAHESVVQEVDLQVIGSSSVVRHMTYERWQEHLTTEQSEALSTPIDQSLRIIGPAGSGKTLALSLRAVQVARSTAVSSQGQKILIVTHSWAMAERIDGILMTLTGGNIPDDVTVLPLLYVLDFHCGRGKRESIEVIGDDSKDGRVAAIELIQEVLSQDDGRAKSRPNLSAWLSQALSSSTDSRIRSELALNLYDEFTGVLSAEAVSIDDTESIKAYLSAKREDWMPPFTRAGDRRFVIEIYRAFLSKLSDRGAITTDQFVADAIRILETFTWRMRRETEGYDYIFVDELQLFDSQERLALELLGRSRGGVPFVTAEDPSQGIFAPLHRRQASSGVDASVYLKAVHRFDSSIFELIKFIYQKFPLNTIPLRIDSTRPSGGARPVLYRCEDDEVAIDCARRCVSEAVSSLEGDRRVCVVTLGDVDDELTAALASANIPVVQLRGFDDIEQLSYRRKSVVVAPWQYVGGTQFSHVVVLAAGTGDADTSFGRLRELTAIYLASSRAAEHLEIVCGFHVPSVVQEAGSMNLLDNVDYQSA